MAGFGKWSPDLPEFVPGSNHLVTCRNVYPSEGGYKPFKGLSAATGDLGAAWVGGGTFEYNGTTAMLGATAAGLFSHSGGAWSSEYVVATTQPWFFVQFGDLGIGFHGGAPVKYTISSGAGALLGGTPPSASFGAIVKDFVFTAGNASDAQTVSWSGLNDAEGWTVGTNESDQQTIPDGGAITGISGGEYALVFQASAINIFEYVGLPFVFTRRKITDELGAITHGSIGRAGDKHFFLSRRGFQMFFQGGFVPIGKDRVDRAFLDTYTQSDIEAYMRCTVDPERSIVMWSMPDRLWIYNWATESWSDAVISGLVGISAGITASATLEEIAVIYPSIEDVTPSLDDAFWRGGSPLLLIFKNDDIGYTFSSGGNLEASFKEAVRDNGRVALIRLARPDTDATQGTVGISYKGRLGDSASRVTSADVRDNGDVPIRASGRYTQIDYTIPEAAVWTYVQGVALEGSAGGRR